MPRTVCTALAAIAIAIALVVRSSLLADDDPFAEDPVNPQARRALIVCGLPGDDDHRKLFAETIENLYTGLTTRLGFLPEHVTVLFSGEATDKDGPALRTSRGPATRERLAKTAAELQTSLEPDDGLWVFILGHAHFDNRSSWLNLPGPDMNHLEFGKLFAGLTCREQVFFITTPASGFFVKPLSAAGRIVIAATEADAEVNETMFPHKLATALAEPPPMSEFDVDGDGRCTLFDAYLWCAREIAQEYLTGELLATEHSLVDDDGDGRGSELQRDYLSEELGGRIRVGRKMPALRTTDGVRIRSILLPTPPAAAPEAAKADEAAS